MNCYLKTVIGGLISFFKMYFRIQKLVSHL